jgi:hypothetical protein
MFLKEIYFELDEMGARLEVMHVQLTLRKRLDTTGSTYTRVEMKIFVVAFSREFRENHLALSGKLLAEIYED